MKDGSRPRRPRPKLYIGQWLRRLGLKQVEVAKSCQIGESHMSLIVSGAKYPSPGLLAEIADALGVPEHMLKVPPPDEATVRSIAGLEQKPMMTTEHHATRQFHLREWRKFKRVKATDLAEALDIERESYYRLEKNWWTISVKEIDVLAVRLGIEPGQFWRRPDLGSTRAADVDLALELIAAIRR